LKRIRIELKVPELECDRLKPSVQFLSHELQADGRDLHHTLSSVTRVNATPLSSEDWIAAFETAGLQVQRQQTGAMQLLNPLQVLRDEGAIDTLKIAWNVVTQPLIRHRVLEMHRTFRQHQQDLHYIIFSATKKQ
jgi:hypothetical protein